MELLKEIKFIVVHHTKGAYGSVDKIRDFHKKVRGWEDIVVVLHNLDSKKNIHYEDRRYVTQTPEVIRDQIATAAFNQRLYSSSLIDAATYEVELKRVEPEQIWFPIMRNLYKVDPVPEHLTEFRWSDTVYGNTPLYLLAYEEEILR